MRPIISFNKDVIFRNLIKDRIDGDELRKYEQFLEKYNDIQFTYKILTHVTTDCNFEIYFRYDYEYEEEDEDGEPTGNILIETRKERIAFKSDEYKFITDLQLELEF